MTRAEACHTFFEAPIVVQLGQDAFSRQQRDWLVREISPIGCARFEFAELDADSPFGAKVFHMGDIITGQRLEHFVAYARWLGGA